MSYCRWSSMDFACDLYCYYSEEGYETHVAARRIVGQAPHVDYTAPIDVTKRQYNEQRIFLDNAGREDITLPEAGESFVDLELVDFEMRLRYLRRVGYCFPDEVFQRIWAERAEEMVAALVPDEKLLEVIHKQFPVLPNESLIMAKLFEVAGDIAAVFREMLEVVYEHNCELEMRADILEQAQSNALEFETDGRP